MKNTPLMCGLARSAVSYLRRLRSALYQQISWVLPVILCMAGASAGAQPLVWKSQRFQYVADHKDLKDVLRDFGASENIMTSISSHVDGSVSGRFDSSPEQFLDKMANTFGFIWYYDGAVLSIAGANEARNATISLKHSNVAELRRVLGSLGIADRRFPIRYDGETGLVIASGPPRYVELVSDVARLIDQTSAPSDKIVVQRFPLNYAWATDRTVTIDGQGVTVRGVASLLRGLYAANGGGQGAVGDAAPAPRDTYRMKSLRSTGNNSGNGLPSTASARPPLPTLPGLSMADNARQPAADVPPLPAGAVAGRTDGNTAEPAAASAGPVIEADPRSNAIFVRDRAENMPAFQALIESLDQRPGVLEIDATIIEITDNALKELGVDWRLHSGHMDVQTGNGALAQTGNPDSLNPQGFGNPANQTSTGPILSTPAGGVLTAVIGGAGRYLLGRVSALQQSDQARVTASPKVETLDNVEAIMDNKQTFYVPVSGYQSADLYSVSAGVSLRVLPMIVPTSSTEQIHLNVHIEDGQLSTQQVGTLPIVSNSTIDTQALINNGESLLIAGYSVDQDDHAETAVPGLSKIPLIGGLFRFKHHQGQRFQRLFLLTPRIIAVSGPSAANVSTSSVR
ncbi:type III secretion system outer membrane ring subunit SctC [Collimonas sp. OK412]|jgi:type III secretion protein C|uniref:type III secretion system outer membrane ring subunit SctC n=1 Tax=Collimonas sp. (strain OK412) TaxID=1801619 RepID=UPI0008E32929|nr:type III secretion system outer membrane ring subunit SctC [Collimonas sp. OK412]SFC95908.1 type III secretion protein C [Collimonas sp. OK412]